MHPPGAITNGEPVNFGEFLWSLLVIFFMICYFMVLFMVIMDLFRNSDMNGFVKAIWILALIFIGPLALLIYVIVYHKGMTERNMKAAKQAEAAQAAYIQNVAGAVSPADQIHKGQELLASGAISQEEFDALKAKALA